MFSLFDPHFLIYCSARVQTHFSLPFCNQALLLKSHSPEEGSGPWARRGSEDSGHFSHCVPLPLAWGICFLLSSFCVLAPRPHVCSHQSSIWVTLSCKSLALLHGAELSGKEPLSPQVCTGRGGHRSAWVFDVLRSPPWAGLSSTPMPTGLSPTHSSFEANGDCCLDVPSRNPSFITVVTSVLLAFFPSYFLILLMLRDNHILHTLDKHDPKMVFGETFLSWTKWQTVSLWATICVEFWAVWDVKTGRFHGIV